MFFDIEQTLAYIQSHILNPVADPGFANRGARLSAAGARIEAPKAPRGVGYGKGVSPSPLGRDLGRGHSLRRKYFDFRSQNVDF